MKHKTFYEKWSQKKINNSFRKMETTTDRRYGNQDYLQTAKRNNKRQKMWKSFIDKKSSGWREIAREKTD